MGFEELLRKKLGPMAALVARPRRPPPEDLDPAQLWYRRAAGLEVEFRPDDTWSSIELIAGDRRVVLDRADARVILGLTDWQRPAEPRRWWDWAQEGLLYFATERPNARLCGQNGVLSASGPVARRANMWPTPAVETATEIAPMPFLPRGRDLAGAELVGFRFASLERGHEVLGVTIAGQPRTGTLLRELLPLLNGQHTASEIVSKFEKRSEAQRMLALLDDLTVLEAQTPPLVLPSDPRVTWLGHAGVLIQGDGASVLVDPLFFAPSDPPDRWDSAPRFDPRTLPPLDAVLITHGDNDHLNAASLAQLPSKTPIYVPRAPDPAPPYQVDFRGMLRVLGFRDVREVDPYTVVSAGPLEVGVYPFVGEDWGLSLAQCTYLIQGASFSVFCAADSLRMDEVYLELKQYEVDLAFMGVSGNAEAMVMPAHLGYGNFYAAWVPETLRQRWVQHCAGPEEARHNLGLFSPRYVFGYAAGGANFIRTSFSDTGDHGRLASLLSGSATRPVSLPMGVPVQLSALGDLPPK